MNNIADMIEESKRAEDERKKRYLSDCRIIQEGITDAALEVLERRFGMHLPVFQMKEDGKSLTCDTNGIMLRAALRDGAHEVILTIKRMKKAKV